MIPESTAAEIVKILNRLALAESLLRRALLQPDSDPALIREIRWFLEGS
jgi:hypothetical protein